MDLRTVLAQSAVRDRRENVTIINNTAANGDDYYISPRELVIIVDNDASYTQNIFLPKTSECRIGQIIAVLFVDYGGGGTLADQDDAAGALWSDLTNDADNEYAILYNTGVGWVKLVSDM
jgi:hypothetical protein